MITTNSKKGESLFIDVSNMEMLPVTVLGDYRENGASGVIDVGCFSAEDTKKMNETGIAYVNSVADNWKNKNANGAATVHGPACSSLFKTLPDGKVIMGRNMDLPISYSPMVIFRTKGNGKDTYDSTNISYSPQSAISFDQIAKIKAIPKMMFNVMMISCSDAFNSEGLYIQYNMRECCDVANSSTNPKSNLRIASFNLIRVLIDHCATIDEVLDYLKKLDIYDSKAPNFDWSMALGVMDKTGKFGVIEFVNNKIVWNEGRTGFACGQCNFYWSKEASGSRFNAGVGRWRRLMEQYYDISSQLDMENVMKSIWYSKFITNGDISRDWKVDWISEVNDKIPYFVNSRLQMAYAWRDNYGIVLDEKLLSVAKEIEKKEKENGGQIWSDAFLKDPANFYDVMSFMDFFIDSFKKLPIEGKKLSGYMECSDISYTANNKEIGYTNHFFETNDIYHIGLHETTIEKIPTKKKF